MNVKETSKAGNWNESGAHYFPCCKKRKQQQKERKSVFKLTSLEEEKRKGRDKENTAEPWQLLFLIAGLSGVCGRNQMDRYPSHREQMTAVIKLIYIWKHTRGAF